MSLIGNFLTGTYLITRTTTGSYDKGFFVPGPKETFKVLGSMQPTSGRDLLLVEEGYRLKQLYTFFSDKPLIPQNGRTLGSSDRVLINGESYRVLSCETWEGTRLNYSQSILTREPENLTTGPESMPQC